MSLSRYSGSGSSSFLGLTDTPDVYTGAGGKVVSVKSDVTGLEFTTASGGGVSDGDKGDIIVSGSGAVWTLENILRQSVALRGYAAMGSSLKALPLAGDVSAVSTSLSLNTLMRFVPVWIPQNCTITGALWFQNTQGNYTASGYNGIGLYTYSGGTLTLVASTTDDGNIWKAATGVATKSFSSTYSASEGLHYIGYLYQNSGQTQSPALSSYPLANLLSGQLLDFTNATKLCGTTTTSALPSSIAMSSINNANGTPFIALY